MQDEKKRDTLTAHMIHSDCGYIQPSETAESLKPEAMEASFKVLDADLEAQKALAGRENEIIALDQNPAGNRQAGVSEKKDEPLVFNGQLAAIQEKHTGTAGLLSESTSGRGTADAHAAGKNTLPARHEASSQASKTAAAALKKAALAHTSASDSAPILPSGPDLPSFRLDDFSAAPLSGTSITEPVITAGGHVSLDQNPDENALFATTAGDTFSQNASRQAFSQVGTALGDDALSVNRDQSQLAATAADQAGSFGLIGDPGSSKTVSGLKAANAVFGSDNHQLQVPGQAVASMLLMIRGGQQSLQVRLRPDHLGELRINLVNGADGLKARLTANSLASCRLLEANLPQLQQALLEKQIICREIEVQYQPPEQQPGYEQPAGNGSRHEATDDFGRQSQNAGQTQLSSVNTDNPAEENTRRSSETPHVRSPYQLDHLV